MRSKVLVALLLLAPFAVVQAQQPHSPPHPQGQHGPHSCGPAHGPNHQSGYGLGNYDLSFDMHGEQSTGVLRINCTDGKLVGTLEAHGQTMTLEVVGIEDMQLTLADESGLSITLQFKNENEFTGKWSHSGESGNLSGARQKS